MAKINLPMIFLYNSLLHQFSQLHVLWNGTQKKQTKKSPDIPCRYFCPDHFEIGMYPWFVKFSNNWKQKCPWVRSRNATFLVLCYDVSLPCTSCCLWQDMTLACGMIIHHVHGNEYLGKQGKEMTNYLMGKWVLHIVVFFLFVVESIFPT